MNSKNTKGLDTETTYNLSVYPESPGNILDTITGRKLEQAGQGWRQGMGVGLQVLFQCVHWAIQYQKDTDNYREKQPIMS